MEPIAIMNLAPRQAVMHGAAFLLMVVGLVIARSGHQAIGASIGSAGLILAVVMVFKTLTYKP